MNTHQFLVLLFILFSSIGSLIAQNQSNETHVEVVTDTSDIPASSSTTAVHDFEEAQEIIEEHNPACANGKPEGPSDAPSACDPDVAGPHLFSAYSGNAHTSSKDIQLWGSAGENGLHFTRYHNTRLNNMTIFEGRFGQQSGWTHNFQYFLRSTPHYHDRPSFQIALPKGGDIFFVQSVDDENLYVPAASVPYRFYRNAENPNLLTLEDANRQLVHFEQKARMHYPEGQTYYRLHSLEDSIGNTTSVHYDHWYDDVLPKKITEPAGRHFWIVYQKYGRLVQMQSQLGGIAHAETPGTWKEITVENGQAFRWLSMMYENNYKNEAALAISEIEFYDENDQQITGTPFGSDPAYGEGQEYDKAFDGDLSTYFRYAYERNGYAGIDLGEGVYKKVSKIRYFLPAISGATTSQAKFVGLSGSDTLQGYGDYVVKEIRASDGRSVIYNYENFTDPSGLFSWMVLDTVEYPDGTQADYSYTQLHDYSRPVLEDILDPRVEGCAPMLSYGYNKNGALGFINHLSSSETAEIIATAGAEGSHTSLFYYGEEGGISERTDFQQDNALPLEHTDANGNTSVYTYDQGGIGYLASTRHPDGNTVSYQRDEFGRLLQEADDGRITHYHRDEKGRLTITGSFLNGQRVSKRIDRKYDDRGRLIERAHKDGDNGLVLEYEQWTYNDFGQVLTHRNMDGSTESWKYYPNGLLQEFTDALGNVNGYSYDNLHRQTHHWNALGRLTLREFNDRGQVTKITDHQSGNTQEFDFDDFGRLIAKTDQSGATWQYSYNEFGQLLSETDPLGHSTTYDYANTSAALTDCDGCAIEKLPLSMTSPEGRITRYSYDDNWNLLSKTFGAGGDQGMTITYSYDKMNNLVSSTEPDTGQGGGSDWEGESFSESVDSSSNSTPSDGSPTSATGRTTYYAASSKPSSGGASKGAIILDPALASMLSDQQNRLIEVYNRAIQSNSIAQVTRVTASNNSSSDSASSSTQSSGPSDTIEYTDSGQISKITENTQESETEQVTEFEYDSLGRLIKKTHSDGSFEEWGYNQLGSAIQYRDRNGVVKTSTYNALEQEVTSTWDDGRPAVTREFDAVGRLLNVANKHISSSYQYDVKGQLLSITHQQNQGGGASSANSYSYDKDGALVSVIYPSGHLVEHQLGSAALANTITLDGGAPLVSYTRGSNGLITERLLENGTQTNYLYDSTPQVNGIEHLNSSGEVIASFDYNSTDDQTLSYQPDYLLSTNEEGASYSYDPQGRPITKTLDGITTLYHWGAKQLLEEQDASTQTQRAYVYGAQDLPELLTIIEADNSSYAHQDSQNNAIALTDQNGEISEATIIDDYGTAIVLDAGGIDITDTSLISSIQNTQSVISNNSATDSSSYVSTGANIGSSDAGSNSTTSSIIPDPIIASNNTLISNSPSNTTSNQVSYNPANIQSTQTTDPDPDGDGGSSSGGSGTTDSDSGGNSSSSGSGGSTSGSNNGGDEGGSYTLRSIQLSWEAVQASKSIKRDGFYAGDDYVPYLTYHSDIANRHLALDVEAYHVIYDLETESPIYLSGEGYGPSLRDFRNSRNDSSFSISGNVLWKGAEWSYRYSDPYTSSLWESNQRKLINNLKFDDKRVLIGASAGQYHETYDRPYPVEEFSYTKVRTRPKWLYDDSPLKRYPVQFDIIFFPTDETKSKRLLDTIHWNGSPSTAPDILLDPKAYLSLDESGSIRIIPSAVVAYRNNPPKDAIYLPNWRFEAKIPEAELRTKGIGLVASSPHQSLRLEIVQPGQKNIYIKRSSDDIHIKYKFYPQVDGFIPVPFNSSNQANITLGSNTPLEISCEKPIEDEYIEIYIDHNREGESSSHLIRKIAHIPVYSYKHSIACLAGEANLFHASLSEGEIGAVKDQGTYDICRELYLKGYNVVYFPESQRNACEEYLKSQRNEGGVEKFSIFGYSHGGGSAYQIANNFGSGIALTGYIDAIHNSSVELISSIGLELDHNFDARPLTERPANSSYHFNFFQRADRWLEKLGVPEDAPTPAGDMVLDFTGEASHRTIDDHPDVQFLSIKENESKMGKN